MKQFVDTTAKQNMKFMEILNMHPALQDFAPFINATRNDVKTRRIEVLADDLQENCEFGGNKHKCTCDGCVAFHAESEALLDTILAEEEEMRAALYEADREAGKVFRSYPADFEKYIPF